MLNKVHYDKCLCCGSVAISKSFSAVDYTVSKENFDVWTCGNCSFAFTQDVPDAAHIGPYYQSAAYVSHSDTREGLINKLYHMARNITLRSKLQLINKVTGKSKGELLDYGAGTGAFAAFMQQAGWQVTGLEPDDIARNNAQKAHNITLRDPNELSKLSPNSFDAISLWHVLEHVHDLHATLESFHHTLKYAGRLLIAVPNYTSYDAQHYKSNWAAWDVPRHLYHFSPKAMEQLMQEKGFVLEKMYPMWFDSIYVSMLSEQYKHGKSRFVAAFLTGLFSNLKALFNASKCSSVIYVFRKK